MNTIKPLSISILSMILFLSSCVGGDKMDSISGDQIMDYPAITLSPRTTTIENFYPATIEGVHTIEIRPKIDGYIQEIYIDEGATVTKGQPLFKINAPQYEQEVRTAQAAIKIAEANVRAAQMEVNKVRPLVEKEILSNYNLENAEINLQSQNAALAQAQAALVNASTNLGYTLISSPINGMARTLPYKTGSLVTANTPLPLTTISDVTHVFAYFSINEKQVLELSSDVSGSMLSNLTSMPPVELILSNSSRFSEKGKLDATSGSINTATGSVRVRATFPNQGDYIQSGTSGVVVMPLTLDSAILIPQKSTYEIQGTKFVYVINEENKVLSTAITVIDNNDGQFYVVTKGLKSGDQIVVDGLGSLRDGITINPVAVDLDSL